MGEVMKLLFRGFLVLLLVWLVGAYFVPKRMQDGPLGIAIQLHPVDFAAQWGMQCAREQGELNGIQYAFKGGSDRLDRAHQCLSIARRLPSPNHRTGPRIQEQWLTYLNFSGRDAEALSGWLEIAQSDNINITFGPESDNAEAWHAAIWSATRMDDPTLVVRLGREALETLSSREFAERVAAHSFWDRALPHIDRENATHQVIDGQKIPNWAGMRLSIAEMVVEALVADGRPEEAVIMLGELYAQEPFVSGRFDLTEHHAAINADLGTALNDNTRLEAALTYWRPIVDRDIERLSDPTVYSGGENLRALRLTLALLGQLDRCDEAVAIADALPISEDLPAAFERPEDRYLANDHDWYHFQCVAASLSGNDAVAQHACGLRDQLEASLTGEEVQALYLPIFEEPLPRPEPSACFLSE